MTDAICRLPLFVPGDRPERHGKAQASGADAVIVDLEDAVAPDVKAQARASLARLGPGAVPWLVRINAVGTVWHAADLAALRDCPVQAVMLPKAEAAEEIASVHAACGLRVIALIETARGLDAAAAIARHPAVAGLAFGSVDFAGDLGAAHMRPSLLLARSMLVLAARLAGLPPPLDGVTVAIDDAAAIEDDARYARELGFGGKLLIHPSQIAAARRGFAPSEAERAWACRVLDADDGSGAFRVDGRMIDAPVLAQARRVLG